MSNHATAYPEVDRSSRLGDIYVGIASILSLAVFVYCIMEGKYLGLVAPVVAILALLVVATPRLALYLFVFVLFTPIAVIQSIPLYSTDLCAGLLVFAMLADVLLSDKLPAATPRLTINFVFLLAAVFITGCLGASPFLSARPFARIIVLLAVFFSVYRLSSKVGVSQLVRLYFWICAAHSMVGLYGFLMTSGTVRNFGVSPATFNGLAMTALPIGVSLAMWSGEKKSGKYIMGSIMVLGGLLSTQSRFSILMGVSFAALVIYLSVRRARNYRVQANAAPTTNSASNLSRIVPRRVVAIIVIVMTFGATALIIQPDLVRAALSRFEGLDFLNPSGTVRLRLSLWAFAWKGFLANPLFGIGPGCFRGIQELVPGLRLDPVSVWVRGLSAHNLILHYLAETGLLGATALVALFANQFRLARTAWKSTWPKENTGYALALYATSLLFLTTLFLETGWMWGQLGYTFAFFVALIVRHYQETVSMGAPGTDDTPAPSVQ